MGDLKSASAGTPVVSSVTTDTPYGFNSCLNAHAVPSTAFRDAVYANRPSPLLPLPKKMRRPLWRNALKNIQR